MAIRQQGVQPVTMVNDGRHGATTYTIRITIHVTIPPDGSDTGGDGEPVILCTISVPDKSGGDEPAETRKTFQT